MTREEQIKKEALFNCNDIAGEVDYKSTAAYEGFIKGAEWADETMIDKACDWLSMNMTSIEYFGINGNIIKPDFIQRFKKAMKGEYHE